MGATRSIRRIILLSLWLVAGTGIIMLLIAAVNSRAEALCEGHSITINGKEEGKWFIDKKTVLDVITSNKTIKLKGRPVKSFDLNRIENRLRREPWIKDADVFFDNNGIMNVSVEERMPVARIFGTSGQSFYIDSTGKKLPLSSRLSARLPVFTNYPFTGKKMTPPERKMLGQIKQLSMYILEDPLWMAQVAQIDITPYKEFEIVPTVGNHVIEFGEAEDMNGKFKRLLVFYRKVLSKSGMDTYARIKVQYDGQVVAVKKSANN